MWGLIVGLLVGVGAGIVAGRKIQKSLYDDGYRDALKTVIDIAVDRGRIAIETSPRGKLGWGAIRAQMSHALEMEFRALLARSRK